MATTKPTLWDSSKNLSSCPLLDKVPSELRVKIYGFLLSSSGYKLAASADNVKNRRLKWRPHSKVVPTSTGASGVVNTSSIEPLTRSRPRNLLDTSIFETCKRIYEEAHFELVSKSTVIIQIVDVKQVVRYPTLLAHICRVEIRDNRHSKGPQVLDIPITKFPPPPSLRFQADHRRALGITHLRWIRDLHERAPMLTKVVIGFEVLRVIMPKSFYSFEGGDIDSQVLGMSVESGFGVVDCVEVGIWRFRPEKFEGVEIRHFNVVAAFERFSTDPCPCDLKGFSLFALAAYAAKSANGLDIIMRHVVGRAGVLGEEARKRCRGREIAEPMSLLEKTLTLLEEGVKKTDNF